MRHRSFRLSIAAAAALCLPLATQAFWWPWEAMDEAFAGGYGYPQPDPHGFANPYGPAIALPPLPALPPIPAAQSTAVVTQPSVNTPAPVDNQATAAPAEAGPIESLAAPAAGVVEADSQHPALPASGEVTLNVVSGGWVLANDRGLTLYTFTQDSPNQSNCTSTCAVKWPPVIASGDAVAIENFSLVSRGDGKQQWAYQGKPLYWWTGDSKPGDMTGDRMGGVWNAARLQ